MNDTKINGSVSISNSTSNKIHDLTILYLKNIDLTDMSIDDLAKKYLDTTNQLNSSLNAYRKLLRNI